MILADSSAWVEVLRRTGSATARAMRRHLDADDVATTDVVIAEVLAGTTSADRLAAWRRALDASVYLAQQPYVDAVAAADLYRRCRRAGESPRQLTDCLVAAVAIRNNVAVLHRDRDYEVLARHTDLEVIGG
jgi:predicted nucleic acid-binding protein